MKGNRYRNPLRTPWVGRIVFGSVTLAVIFAAFVYLRNRQVKQGDEIHEAEKLIVQVDKEIEMWELRIAGLLDRNELDKRLVWVGSELEDIKASRILILAPDEEVQALPRVAVR